MNKICSLFVCFWSLTASQHMEINIEANIRQEYINQISFLDSVNKLIAFIHANGFDITPEDYQIKNNITLFCVAHKKEVVKSLNDIQYSIDLTIIDLHGNVVDSYDVYRDFGAFWESLDSSYKWGGNIKFETKK